MIKLLAIDIDGTLTDGGYYSPSIFVSGFEHGYFRKFNTRDFVGIKLLVDAGLKVVFITGATYCCPEQFERAA